MAERFVIRPDREGYSVSDLWTGEAVVIAMVPQTGLGQEDAEHTAALLNRRGPGRSKHPAVAGDLARAGRFEPMTSPVHSRFDPRLLIPLPQ